MKTLLQLMLLVIFFLSSYCVFGKKRANVNKINKETISEEYKQNFLLKKRLHKLKVLSQNAVKRLANLNDYSAFYSAYLKNLLRVRVPGTVGHHEVKQFIIKTLKSSNWHVELDEFDNPTPLGNKKFTNIIATLNPNADRRLALAAHYDSKLLAPKNGKYFLAATDSAVPCAMLLDLAKLLSEKSRGNSEALKEVSPMIIFLDGEEAFIKWTKDDSIYGSRHLANTFSEQPHHKNNLAIRSVTMLDSLDAFVLFDLIGAKNPQFLDLYHITSHLYKRMRSIEKQLKTVGQINNTYPYFSGASVEPLYIEDDHVPFLEKGVPILHVIPVPFPKVWHTLDDDESALDPTTIEQLLKIFRQFVLEYFHLST